MNTAEGREQYRRNLIGIKQCVQETNNHDVVSALINARNYDREWERPVPGRRNTCVQHTALRCTMKTRLLIDTSRYV